MQDTTDIYFECYATVKLMNKIKSLFIIVFRLIAIQVLLSYLQAHLDLQTMHNVIYLGVFGFINIVIATVFISCPLLKTMISVMMSLKI